MTRISYNPLLFGQGRLEAPDVPFGATTIPGVDRRGETQDVFVNSEIPEGLVTLLRNVQQAKTEEIAPDEILIPALDSVPELYMVRPGYYVYGDFQILSGIQAHTDRYVDKLKLLNQLGVTSAPQVMQYLQFPGGDSLLITKIPNCDVRTIVPYAAYGKPISRENRDLFLNEMKFLLDNNLFNPHMAKPSYWQVNPETGRIMLNNWNGVVPFPEHENKDQVLEKIKTHLDSFY